MMSLRSLMAVASAAALTVWSSRALATSCGPDGQGTVRSNGICYESFFWTGTEFNGTAHTNMWPTSLGYCYPTQFSEIPSSTASVTIENLSGVSTWVLTGSPNGQMGANCVSWPTNGLHSINLNPTWFTNDPGGACYELGSRPLCIMSGNDGSWPTSAPAGAVGTEWYGSPDGWEPCMYGSAFGLGTEPEVGAECLNLSVSPPSGLTYYDWSNANNFGQNVQMSLSATNICFIDFIEAVQSDGYMYASVFDDGTHWQLTGTDGTEYVQAFCIATPH